MDVILTVSLLAASILLLMFCLSARRRNWQSAPSALLWGAIFFLLIAFSIRSYEATLRRATIQTQAATINELSKRIDEMNQQSHKDWLEPHPKGFIPELNDAADLMWIEGELAKKSLKPATRATLETLRTKGLTGQLKDSDLVKFRRQAGPMDAAMKSLLSKLRALRRQAAKLAAMPPEAITDLDAAIGEIEKAVAETGKS